MITNYNITLNNDTKDIKLNVFKLKNYLEVDIFAEEFIAYNGIKVLLDVIKVTSGNTRVIIFLINF